MSYFTRTSALGQWPPGGWFGKAKEVREEGCRDVPISGGNDRVVEYDRHVYPLTEGASMSNAVRHRHATLFL
jgi:hypothetical protein